MEISIYIHYPFCLCKCLYCAFNSVAEAACSPDEYVNGLLTEMELRRRALEFDVSAVTIYLGGGTPSLMEPDLTARLVETATRIFHLTPDAEITLECNPGTVTRDRLADFRSAGVNRLSLGVQSFNDDLLRSLGRIHSAREARNAFHAARASGFDNVGIDLIHSLPGQTAAMWLDDLLQACALRPEHLSVYGLTIEEGTPFFLLEQEGKLPLPDEDESAGMYEKAAELLPEQGYEQYEIANFARKGYRSVHNSGYWNRRPFLGFGAGAHSFLQSPGYGVRFSAQERPEEYLGSLTRGELPVAETRTLSRRDAMAEFFFLGLRTSDGVSLEQFRREFSVSFDEAYGDSCAGLFSACLLEVRDGFLRLTGKGRILSNQVFVRFL
jgi:oxygen-independent coproporphyrinogen-3 oxidase